MRLGRPLAAASAVAAMAGASLIASPALASDSNGSSTDSPSSSSESSATSESSASSSPGESTASPTSSDAADSGSGFRIIQKRTFASASTNTSFTVSGTDCTGRQATVDIALYAPDGGVSDVVKTEAASDGTWSTDVDIASLIKSIGSSIAPGTDGWTIGASCTTYGDQTDTTPVTNRQQAPIFFDDTRITGSYEVSAASEGGSQTFSFNAQGFYAGEKVSVVLKNKNDADIQYALGELTVDTSGSLLGALPAPADAADGEYLLVLTGSHHDETAASQTLTTVSNRVFTINDDGNAGSKADAGSETGNSSTGEPRTTEPSATATQDDGNAGSKADAGSETGNSSTGEPRTTEPSKTSDNPGGGDHADRGHQASGGLGPTESPEHPTAGHGSTANSNAGSNNDDPGKKAETGQRADSQGRDGSPGGKESSSRPKAADNGKALAHTGANSLIFGGIAALFVVVGGGVLLLRRRSKN
ncbi:LPXTG cell wall anchor domain-containing protein [uncultured Actinomyces sp.]|uniref:LPXTG cell wall anchor domain-containing protein n=1 Tax=uncultured Actinomyces sp. TaxID=249061 RepID=UPI0028D3CA9E|nr:LPXTG cell wall anchor domain-containing protein [uncultured Actinomyces sp.]